MDYTKFHDYNFVLDCILKLFLVFNSIRIFEFFCLRKEFKTSGIFAWDIHQLKNKTILSPLKVFDFFFSYNRFFILLIVSLICSWFLFFIYYPVFIVPLLFLIFF